MKSTMRMVGVVAVAAALATGCSNPGMIPTVDVAAAAKGLRVLIPGIQAGLALVKPDFPTSRALDPDHNPPVGWPYGIQPPAQVYGSSTGTLRLPLSGYYSMNNGDQIYLTLTPELAMGATYFRIVLYTYPAFDLSVAYTIEEYIVNSLGTESWPWGNLDLTGKPNSWVSLTTAYADGTSGVRTVVSASGTAPWYSAFAVNDPDPTVPTSFNGYRYDDLLFPPSTVSTGMSYSSKVTEKITGKGNVIDSTQYYTETDTTHHSGLTYVAKDKKRKWSVDTFMVTRMEENTAAAVATKKIRSVVAVGSSQYYIDKVDISKDGSGKIVYISTHDVYDTAVPKGGDPKAADYVFLSLIEDSAGKGTFTGTMEESQDNDKIVRDITVNRDSLYRMVVKMKYKSTGVKTIADDVEIPLTRQDISNLSIPMSAINGTFSGYYEAGSLFGTITIPQGNYDVVVTDEGVAINDVLYPY